MIDGQHDAISRSLNTLFGAGTVTGLTDGQLLERFRARGANAAEPAFAALVERHGPMVLRVCRSVLRDVHAADDAFQATFLVLARRSGSLWVGDSLGPWLHQVAYRVASSARASAARRHRLERRAGGLAGPQVHEQNRDDLDSVLRNEVSRLPRGCRVVVLLCYFEGLSPAQAARRLDCPLGTVQSRLARGREQLRSRLLRRGLAPALVVLGADASAEAATPALVERTVRAALARTEAGWVSASVIRLTQGALQAMFLSKLRAAAAVIIAIAALGAGALSLLQKTPASALGAELNQAQAAEATTPRPAPNADARPAGRIYTTASLDTDRSGRPIPSVVAVDPATGNVTKVFENSPGRLRVSPDGRSVAYVAKDQSPIAGPGAPFTEALWVRSLTLGAAPRRVASPAGASAGDLPVWSPDSRQIILSKSTRDQDRNQWIFETFRVNIDGSGEQLAIPQEDCVQDWSSDGAWIVTASNRKAKIGWQLYVMRPDGSGQRQITEGGNPFYVRFSPDGKRLLYSDGTLRLPERQGIWVVDRDGQNRRHIFPTGNGNASGCWSPDGRWIAVAMDGPSPEEHGRLEIVELDGAHRTLLKLPTQRIADMPDWR